MKKGAVFMDTRIRLDPGTILAFPGMKCTIESFAGQGSNSLVYLGTYPDAEQNSLLHRVLIKELFPYDAKGMIYRDRDSGDILCMPDAKPAQELHRLSFLRANQAHLKLLEHHPSETDGNINTFSLHNTLYSVLGYSGGRSLEKELQNSSGGTLMDHIKRIRGALDALEAFHNENLLHLDVSPDNILLIGEGARERVSLIDFNSVHTIDEIRSGESLYYSAKEGYTPPEIRAGKMTEIGFATDLFSLTAVFYLLGVRELFQHRSDVSAAFENICKVSQQCHISDLAGSNELVPDLAGVALGGKFRFPGVGSIQVIVQQSSEKLFLFF